MSDIIEHASDRAVASYASGTRFPRADTFKYLTRWRLGIGVQILDLAVIIGIAMLVCPVALGAFVIPMRFIIGASAVALFCHAIFLQGQLYQIDVLLDETRAIKAILVRWSLVFLGLAAAAAFAHQEVSLPRIWFTYFFVCGAGALAAERSVVALVIRQWIRRGYVTQSVVVVGHNSLTERLISRVEKNRSGIRVVGVFDDRMERLRGDIRGVPLLGNVEDLLEYSKCHTVDLVVITLAISAAERMHEVIGKIRHQPLNIRVLPGEIGLDRVSPIRLSSNELPGVQLIAVADRPMSEFALFLKGAIDRIAAMTALVFFAPLFLVIACGISLSSPGPVFYRQMRVGYQGHMFRIFKFRTMHVSDKPNTRLTERNDPRIFAFGSILRKLSLDELPQLINVVNGDMSLVGPRPHMPEARAAGKLYYEAVNEYAARHRVKPGITGWAQINGWRGPTETLEQIERRVEHDMYYIENWTLTLDIVILIRTLFVGFFGKNAF